MADVDIDEAPLPRVSAADITQEAFERDGVTGAFRALTPAGAGRALRAVLSAPPESLREACHAAWKWADELVRSPAVVGPVARALGARELLCIESTVWVKHPGSAAHVSWHQDVRYWRLAADHRVASVWVALSPVPREAGPVRLLPGSHARMLPHEERGGVNNMLSRGQTIPRAAELFRRVLVAELAAGEAFAFSGRTAHSSAPLAASYPVPRVGVSLRYATPEVRPLDGVDYASPVLGCGGGLPRGWAPIRRPAADLAADAVAMLREVQRAKRASGAAGHGQDSAARL